MDLENLLFSSDDEDERPRIRRVYRPRINFDVLNDFHFKEKFRLRRNEVQLVLDRIGGHLPISDRNMALHPRQQILVALHWMGNGGYYHGIADMHGISKSTVCRIVERVVHATVDHLFHDTVRWPDNVGEIAAEFLQLGGFPSVAGCVDGTLIKIDAPSINEEQFVDRHGNHSLNAMMVCGPDYSFYYVNARWPGSVHDARVLRTSTLNNRFQEGWRPFPGAIILGDSGYPLKDWLIPPYTRNIHDAAEVRFNRAHKSTRRIVENAYGILKERFPCLNYMRLKPTLAGRIVMACTTFHNIACKDDFDLQIEIDDIEPGEVQEVVGNARIHELLNYFR